MVAPRFSKFQLCKSVVLTFVSALLLFMSVECALLGSDNVEEECKEEWAPDRGHYDSNWDGDKWHYIVCPDNGAFIGIDYTWLNYDEGKRVQSIGFTCQSSVGVTRSGPFGTPSKNYKKMHCPENHHISHMRGKAGYYLNDIQINCVQSGLPVNNTNIKQGGRAKREKRDESNTKHDFDESCYTTHGRRIVAIRIYSKNIVNGMASKYLNIPVALNCKVTEIELVDVDANAQETGYEVLGITIGSSCSTLVQQLFLSVQLAEFALRSTTSSITDVKMISIFTDNGSVNYIADNGNSSRVPIVNPSANTAEDEKLQKTTINYKGPGTSVLVGYRRMYRLNNEKALVLHRYTCEGGSKEPAEGEIEITGNIYGNVHFQDYYFPFTNTKCTPRLTSCISRIRFDSAVFHPELLGTELESRIKKCIESNNRYSSIKNSMKLK